MKEKQKIIDLFISQMQEHLNSSLKWLRLGQIKKTPTLCEIRWMDNGKNTWISII